MNRSDIQYIQNMLEKEGKQEVYGDLEELDRQRLSLANRQTEALALLIEAEEFMKQVPNNTYGDNYAICSRINKFLSS